MVTSKKLSGISTDEKRTQNHCKNQKTQKKQKKTKKTCLPAELLCETSSSLLSTTASRSQGSTNTGNNGNEAAAPPLLSTAAVHAHGWGGAGREGDNPGMMDMLFHWAYTCTDKISGIWLLDFIYNLPIDELQLITGKL